MSTREKIYEVLFGTLFLMFVFVFLFYGIPALFGVH